ncbi:MAG: ComEC/Rec2 family competence protein [Fibrobacterota bacterium]
MRVIFINAGDGDLCILNCPGGKNVMVDTGPFDSLMEFLPSLPEFVPGGKIEHLFLTHPHADHIGNVREILSLFDVKKVSVVRGPPFGSFYTRRMDSAFTAAGIIPDTIFMNDSLCCGETVFHMLWPPDSVYSGEGNNVNNNSLVLLSVYGKTELLLTGDLENSALKDFTHKWDRQTVDLLKVPHHGASSSFCPQFIQVLSPEYALISCGKENKYGHPDSLLTAFLKQGGSRVNITGRDGNVIYRSDGLFFDLVKPEE